VGSFAYAFFKVVLWAVMMLWTNLIWWFCGMLMNAILAFGITVLLISLRLQIQTQHFRSIWMQIWIRIQVSSGQKWKTFFYLENKLEIFSHQLQLRPWLRTSRLKWKLWGLQQIGKFSFQFEISSFFFFGRHIYCPGSGSGICIPNKDSDQGEAISIPDPKNGINF